MGSSGTQNDEAASAAEGPGPTARAARGPGERRQRITWALVAGVLLGLSQPLVIGFLSQDPIDPTGLSGLLVLVGYVPLLVLMRDDRPKRAYWLAFLAILVASSITLYWLVIAMTVFGRINVFISIAALLLLTSVMGFWLATPFAVTRLVVRRFALPQWLVFPVMFTAADLLRNYGPNGGFPWGTTGQSLATVPLLLQGASLVGVYGLGFVIALVNAVLAEVFIAWRRKEPLPRRPLLVGSCALGLLLAWGTYRLVSEPEHPRTVKVAMLQGNIEQGIKNDAAQNAGFIEERYQALQQQALAAGADVVVWPEASLPSGVRTTWEHLRSAGVVPRKQRGEHAATPPAAIIGAVAYEKVDDPEPGERRYRSYNTALATGDDLEVLGRFDKRHLVPFGEYVPWPLGAIVKKIVPGVGTTPGERWAVVELPIDGENIPVGTTICYEGIFPEITRAFVDGGAQLMFNVTNDAWYGVSSAAKQHLAFYAMRAAETGRAVARAANTGITAWVDTRGRVHDETRLYTHDLVIADLPLSSEITPYVTLREWVALPATLLGLGLWFYALVGTYFWRRQRHLVEWIVGAGGLALAAFATTSYYMMDGLYGDEAAANRAASGTVAALLIGLGALSGRPWGRKAQLWVGGLALVLCGVGAAFGSLGALGFALVGGVILVLAWKRKDAYVREADPELSLRYSHEQ